MAEHSPEFIFERLMDAWTILHRTPAKVGQQMLDDAGRSDVRLDTIDPVGWIGNRDELSQHILEIAYQIKNKETECSTSPSQTTG